MPQYKVEIPGQGAFRVDSPEPLTEEQAYTAALRQLNQKAEPPKPAEDTEGFFPALKAGTAGAKGSAALLAGKLGLMSPEAAEAYNKEQEEYGKSVFTPTQKSWGEAPFQHVKELFGGSLPYMAAPVIGGMVAPEAAVGAGLASLAQFTGTNLGRQVEEGKSLREASLGSAAMAAIPQAALDVLSLKMLPGVRGIFGAAGKQVPDKLLEDITKQGLMRTIGSYTAATGKAMTAEGLTEAAQQFFERLQAGLSINDAAARDEYWQNLIGGAVLGGAIAPVGHAFERAGQRGQYAAQQPAATPVSAPVAAQPPVAGEEIPEPTLRSPEAPLEAVKKLTKEQERKINADRMAYLKKYAEQAASREAAMAEYERVKALSPEEFAAEQMQGGKPTKKNTYDAAAQARIQAEAEAAGLDEKYPQPHETYAAQQVALAKDREPTLDWNTYTDYLMQDPAQARKLVDTYTPIPGLPPAASERVLRNLSKRLDAMAVAQEQQRQAAGMAGTTSAQQRLGSVEEEERQALEAQRAEEARLAGEAAAERRLAPEVLATRGLGKAIPSEPYRGEPKKVSERLKLAQEPLSEEEEAPAESDLVNKLVEALPLTNGKIQPGDVYLGLGTRKNDTRDLQAQLAVARLTRNKTLQEDIKRQLDEKRAIPTEGDAGTEGGKTAAEFIARSKAPELLANEAEADKFASEQRSTLLGLAKLLASTKIMLPAKRAEMVSEAKEKYIAQHAAEIEARRKAFGLPPMEDWERAEARARALEGLNTLTNNWGQFEDPVISVKALQNITREAVYQNLYKAVQRKNEAVVGVNKEKLQAPKGQQFYYEDAEGNRIEGKGMEIPRETGPRIAAPAELSLKDKPRRAAEVKQDALDMIAIALDRKTRVAPAETKKAAAKVNDLADFKDLFKESKQGGETVAIEAETIALLEKLRDALPASSDPEFHKLALEQAQQIVEGNQPNPFAVRDLLEMMKEQEVAGRSETRPGATPEELQRTSAQPQKDLFPEAAVQTQRATVSNFQKMLDSKNVQGMRDAIEKQRQDNLAALQAVGKKLPTLKNRLAKAEEKYKRTQKRAEAAGTEAHAYVSEYKTALGDAQDLVNVLREEIRILEDQLKDVELTKDVLAKEPTDMRFLINAPKMLAQEKPLRSGLKLMNAELANAQALIASIEASYKAQQTLVVPAQRRAEAIGKELDVAKQELADVKNEAAREQAKAQAAAELADAEAKYKEFEGTVADINAQARLAAAQQKGQEGLGLTGMRFLRDTASIKEDVANLRRKLGSKRAELEKREAGKRKNNDTGEIRAEIDALEAELAAQYEKTTALKSEITTEAQQREERIKLDLRAQRERQEAAIERKRRKLPPEKLTPTDQAVLQRDIRTGRISQPFTRIRTVEPVQAITNKMLAKRAELAETQRRIDFLKANGKDKVKNKKTELFKSLEEKAALQRKQIDRLSGRQVKFAAVEREAEKRFTAQQERQVLADLEKEKERFARGVEVESPDLSAQQVSMLEKNDITAALDSFADDKNTSVLNKVVAQRLAAMLGNTDVELKNEMFDDEGKPVLGSASSKGTRVQLSRKGGLSQEVLLHEGTHAATERVLEQYEADPTQLSEIQRVAVRELKALHKAVQSDPRFTSVSAKGSLSEFVAEVFSNRNLQEQLRSKKWRLSDAWKGFKSIILRMLGIKDPETMLGAALQAVDAIMLPSTERTEAAEKVGSERLSVKDIAALHTGSNSMKQFSEQFGDAIKQKDRTPEDADRIGREYLDDMYANPLNYVSAADNLDYSVRTSDGKPFDMDNALHYVEADAADFAMLKAQEDPRLQEREALALTANRKKDLKALVKNLGDSGEYTYVEQALVAKAAAKYAVIADKSGRLKLATIDPNNRHEIAVVSAEDAGRIIQELRAGKSLKQAFLDGMQKNADVNAKNNERKNGWQKFEQSDDYKAGVALNAACAGTPWCTGAQVETAKKQIERGDFYVYYKNGRPEVAVRMDGQNKIGEVRGNSPNQSLNAEQEEIARSFLQANNFEKSKEYLKEFDTRKFLVGLLKGETDFALEELFSNPPSVDSDGKVTNYAVTKLLNFRALDGYGGRPPATKPVGEQIRKRIQYALDDAEAHGYYPTKDARLLSGTTFKIGDLEIPADKLKGAASITLHSGSLRDLGNTLPALEYVNDFATFGDIALPAAKQIGELVLYKDAVVTLPKNVRLELVRPTDIANVTIKGPERIEAVRLQPAYGDRSYMNLTLPDTKFVNVVAPKNELAGRIAYRAGQLLEKAGITFDDFEKFEKGLKVLSDRFGGDVTEGVFDDYIYTDPEVQGSLSDGYDYTRAFAEGLLKHKGFDAAETGSQERQTIANQLAEEINKAWELEGTARFGTENGSLIAPKRVTEVEEYTEAPEQVRYARAAAPGFETELKTAEQMIAKPKTVRQVVEANTGLAFRTQVLDRLAPLEKIATDLLDPLKGMQMMHYLRMADQKMSFVQQSVARGVPQISTYTRKDGNTERIIESRKGANLASVVNILKDTPGMNAQAANQLFTLYLAAKRGDRVGYDVLNTGASEEAIKSAVAKIEANEGVRDVFERARTEYNNYNRDLVEWLRETGVITPEEADRLSKTNDYIPYYREQDGNAVLVIGGEGTFTIGNLADQPQLRQLIGGEQKILDFLTSSVQNTSMMIDMGLRNQAAKNAMYELVDLNLAHFLGKDAARPDVVRFKDKGVDKFVQVATEEVGIPADLLVKGMEGIPVNNSAVVKAMAMPATLMRRAVTMSPLYAMRQVFRDSVAAQLTSGANFTPVLGALNQIGHSATREKLESRGVVGGQVFTGTNEDLSRILGELQSGEMGIGQFIAKAEAMAMEADALTRRAQYESYIAQGLSEMEATMMALESMNFNRKGLSPSVRLASTLIPFFNAQLQSLDVLYRAMTGKMPMNERLGIQRKLYERGMLLAGTSVAYALLMQDDETYKNANPDEKYGNFFVHVPGIKEAIRVPVPFEIGYIFKSLPEAIVNTMLTEDGGEEALKAFKQIAIQTVPGGTSMFLPAAVKPIVENVTNYSFYTGRSLETKAEQMEQAQYRYRDNTSEVAKALGAAFGASPIKIENLIRGYTGGMGLALTQAISTAMPTAGTPEEATKRLSDTPVIGPLFQPTNAGGIVGAVYDRMNEIKEIKITYDRLIKEGRTAEAREFMQKNTDAYAMSAVSGNVQQQLAKITQAMNAVKASNMSPDEKRERLDALQDLRIKIAENMRGVLRQR